MWESRQSWSPLCLERPRRRSHCGQVVVSCSSTATSPSRDACISTTSISIHRSGKLQAELHIQIWRSSLLTSNEDSYSQARTRATGEKRTQQGSVTRVQLELQPWMLRLLHLLPCQQTQGNFYGGLTPQGMGPPPSPLRVPHLSALQTAPVLLFPQNNPLISTQQPSQTHSQPSLPQVIAF